MSDPTQSSARSSHPGPRGPGRVFRPNDGATAKRSALDALRATLEKAGLDVEHLHEQRSEGRAKLEATLARFRADSDERAAGMQHTVARSAEAWLKANHVRKALAPANAFYSVSTADGISTDTGLDLRAEHIGPWANTAEVVFSEQTSDVDFFNGKVDFAFSWPNPTGTDVLCNVTGILGVAATAIVTADGYWWPLDPTPPASRIDVSAELAPRVLDANGQVTVPPVQSTQFQGVTGLVVFGNWGGEGAIAGQDIFRGYVLQCQDLFLPAAGKLEVDLICHVGWDAIDGGGEFIAAGRDRKLSGFGLFIETQA